MRMNKLYTLLATVAVLSSCGGRQAGKLAAGVEAEFPQAVIPGIISDPAERLSWICAHFWDPFTDEGRTGLCDTALVAGVDKVTVEEQFGLFATLLGNADPKTADAAMIRLYERGAACEERDPASNVFETFVEFAAKYFFDPNSPVRSEEVYLPFVERLAESPYVSEGMRSAYAYDASICRLNRPGTVAADFRFTDLQGRSRTLHGVKAPLTLLFFSNPGCEACKEIIDLLQSEDGVTELIAAGRLAVVNVYIDDDIEVWKDYAVNYPAAWYSGYDPDYAIRTGLLYAVRAIPSLYLLDGDKKVLIKDGQPETVLDFILSQQG